MKTIQESEKPARNLAIRKFSELITIKNLEEALSHLDNKELCDAINTLAKSNPQDLLISRKAKTLEMTKLVDEIKCLLTEDEKMSLLHALRLESQDLENRIVLTKKAIDKRAQADKYIHDALEKIQKETEFDKAILFADDPEFFASIELLTQADALVYEEKQKFIMMLKELVSIKEKILNRDKASLLKSIQSNEAELLKQSLQQAKDSIKLHAILSQILNRFAEENYFAGLFEKEQTELIANAKGFFKPKMINPAKLPEMTLLDAFAQNLAQDLILSLDERANIFYGLLALIQIALPDNKKSSSQSIIVKTMKELENTTFINSSFLKENPHKIASLLTVYLEDDKLNSKEKKLIALISGPIENTENVKPEQISNAETQKF